MRVDMYLFATSTTENTIQNTHNTTDILKNKRNNKLIVEPTLKRYVNFYLSYFFMI